MMIRQDMPLDNTTMSKIISNWIARHQHRTSQLLHALGIPMLVAGLLLGAWQLYHQLWAVWYRPVALITISYILQAIGHAIEGNDMGEVVLIKKLLKKPYIAIAPQQRHKERK